MGIKNSKSLQDYAYNYVKGKILNETFIEGKIYSETKLAKEIEVSRTPIRYAFQRLVQEGFIDIIPSKVFRLHKFTEKEIIEIFEIRSAIEGFCTLSLAKKKHTEIGIETIEKLKFILEQQENLLNKKNSNLINEFVEYDILFHTTIVEFVKNMSFNDLFSGLMYRIKRLAIESLSHPGRLESTFEEHSNILKYIIAGDLENIYEITLIHIESPKYINLSDYCG